MDLGDDGVGTFGEIHPAVLEAFGIDGRVSVAEFDLATVMGACPPVRSYEPIPAYPPVRRDLSFVVPEAVEYADLEKAIRESSRLLSRVELFDVYRDDRIGADRKSLALHLEYVDPSRTLTAEEADTETGRIVVSLEKEFGASIRS
jgi:phenylalanyl-tRNA synthetase beta chain